MADKTVFETLNAINVNDKTEEKNGLTYLSWAWAWGETKKRYPDADYKILRFGENQLPFQFVEKLGLMCWTSITICGETKEMWLPVMDNANRAMMLKPYKYTVKNPYFKYAKLDAKTGKYLDKYGHEQQEYMEKTCEAATMFDINKTIMRCLVKNLAMFGLGLYIYAGEDLPENENPANKLSDPKTMEETQERMKQTAPESKHFCADCGIVINDDFIANGTMEAYGRYLCRECGLKAKRAREAAQ